MQLQQSNDREQALTIVEVLVMTVVVSVLVIFFIPSGF